MHEIGVEVYRRTLHQEYLVHLNRNSSEIVGGLSKVDSVAHILSLLMDSLSAAMMAVALVLTLIYIQPSVALITLLGLGSVYGAISVFSKRKLIANSKVLNVSQVARVQAVQEGLGAIRDVIIDHAQSIFLKRFTVTDRQMRDAQASNNIMMPSPRFIVEAMGMVLIGLIAYYISVREGGLLNAIPVIGALAMGSQRLMPLVQMMYRGGAYVLGHRKLLEDVVDLLNQPISGTEDENISALEFDNHIALTNLSFQYEASERVLKNVGLKLPAGAVVGFVGKTGSGKSTLIDIIMGLLAPTDGHVAIDGVILNDANRRAWRQNIAHVSQAIYLVDASFKENIAFGVPKDEIDEERVARAARLGMIDEYIQGTPQGYDSHVGERGVRISGGQRQRIGIARAIYKETKILVLDEATSALDHETERQVIETIIASHPGITILMIAHRITTLSNCDHIYQVVGGIVESTNFQSLEAVS